MLLLHGFPQCSYAWRRQIPVLARRFRTVAPDLRGYGETDKPAEIEAYRVETLVRDVVELVRALGAERAHLVGHDWGGAIAWATAILAPEVVERLVVLNCPHPIRFARALRTSLRQIARSWYVFLFQLPWLPEWLLTRKDAVLAESLFRRTTRRPEIFSDADLEEYRRNLLRPGAARAMVNYYRALLRDLSGLRRLEREYRPIAAPTLLVWGEDDVALGRELAEGMEPLFAGPFRVHYVPNCSHWVNEEEPELVNRLLIEHLGCQSERGSGPGDPGG